ncbi:hypothetical protein MYCTH_2310831 [Thermothelomyces thermophilus ATCC 42464]|uniref:DNA replication complex GINS protein PSF2 n=1 Tax=Thermothelomyces thermophilus (strain ATCC 42464 / BCRC 31852 / DSM 1799) TaxID=573729 RepID=G2QM68_THET4|nr:uncharacterized protein MYCTH_2310831 [Thermothelomyces thermophilus ATCC 42464]AEO61048.1 hypothetical protein MYCTH_2310831 [Thermothelomyces thermophilus ATCC 42464]
MALPLPPGLTHAEVAFLAEMELVTVVPRQRLDSIDLLSGKTPPLRPPHRADLPLWLALLLKKQRRANILPPAWLHPDSLRSILLHETKVDPDAFSPPPPPPARADPARPGMVVPRRPQQQQQHQQRQAGRGGGGDLTLSAPFVASCTADAPAGYLPYHWLEVAEALLAHAGDDVAAALGGSGGGGGGSGGGTTTTATTTSSSSSASTSSAAGEVRGLLRDLVEVRAAKMRSSAARLEGFGGGLMSLRGVGAMELAESRGFVLGVVDGVRKLGATTEAARREEEEEERMGEGLGEGESDEEMGI